MDLKLFYLITQIETRLTLGFGSWLNFRVSSTLVHILTSPAMKSSPSCCSHGLQKSAQRLLSQNKKVLLPIILRNRWRQNFFSSDGFLRPLKTFDSESRTRVLKTFYCFHYQLLPSIITLKIIDFYASFRKSRFLRKLRKLWTVARVVVSHRSTKIEFFSQLFDLLQIESSPLPSAPKRRWMIVSLSLLYFSFHPFELLSSSTCRFMANLWRLPGKVLMDFSLNFNYEGNIS